MRRDHHNLPMHVSSTIVISLIIGGCFGCSWSGFIKFSDIRHPVSMSAYLYSPQDEVLTMGKGLTMVKKFSYEKTYWSIVGPIPLSSTNDIAENINKEIEKSSGNGMVNVKIYVNTRAGMLLVVYRKIKVEGDIVKFGHMAPLSD